MQYALLIYNDQSSWAEIDDEEAARLRAESMPRWIALFEELGKADADMVGRELEAATEAKVVRVVDGERSRVWPQVENRMHAARGLLAWLLDQGRS